MKFLGEVIFEILKKVGFVGNGVVKILGNGEFKSFLMVKVYKFLDGVKKVIEVVGGKIEVIK